MTRDMTEVQFRAALKRNGFERSSLNVFGRAFLDTTGQAPGVHFGGIYSIKPARFLRRETLAHLIKSRVRYAAVERERKAKKAAPPSNSMVAA